MEYGFKIKFTKGSEKNRSTSDLLRLKRKSRLKSNFMRLASVPGN